MRMKFLLVATVLLSSTIPASAATIDGITAAGMTDTVLGVGAAGAISAGLASVFSGSSKSVAIVSIPQAPEISSEGLASGVTLLSGMFFVMTGRRRKR